MNQISVAYETHCFLVALDFTMITQEKPYKIAYITEKNPLRQFMYQKINNFVKSEMGKFLIITIVTVAIYLVYLFFSNKHEAMMRKSKITFGIIDGIRSSNRSDNELDFHFKDSHNETVYIDNYTHNFDCGEANIGDTITIKYSLINSDYVDLVHFYWR